MLFKKPKEDLLWNLEQDVLKDMIVQLMELVQLILEGVAGTATVSAGEMFDIPVVGTMAHSFCAII